MTAVYTSIEASMFKRLVQSTALAAEGPKGWMPAFQAVSITLYENGTVEFAATDRYRLAVATLFADPKNPTLPPKDSIKHVALVPAKELLAFANRIVVSKKVLRHVEMNLYTEAIDLIWNRWSHSIEIDSNADDFVKYRDLMDKVEVKSDFESVCFNPTFLADAAKGCKLMSATTGMTIRFTDALRPAFFKPEYPVVGMDYTYLLMPRRPE